MEIHSAMPRGMDQLRIHSWIWEMLSPEPTNWLLTSWSPQWLSTLLKGRISSSEKKTKLATSPLPLTSMTGPSPTHSWLSKLTLTLRPLPCDLSTTLPLLISECVTENESVTVRVKIGAFFSILLPHESKIERVKFDFSDSLLDWNSACMTERSASCSVTHN